MSRVSDDTPAQISWMACGLALAFCLMLGAMAIQACAIYAQGSAIAVKDRVIKAYEKDRGDWSCLPLDGSRNWDYKLCSKPRVK